MAGVTLNKFFEIGDSDTDKIESNPSIRGAHIKSEDVVPAEPKVETKPKAETINYDCNININSELNDLLRAIAKSVMHDEKSNKITIRRIYLCETSDEWNCIWLEKKNTKYGKYGGSTPKSFNQSIEMIRNSKYYIREIAHPRDSIFLFWGWQTNSSNVTSLWYKGINMDGDIE
jgi:hypothetical protein